MIGLLIIVGIIFVFNLLVMVAASLGVALAARENRLGFHGRSIERALLSAIWSKVRS